MKSFFTVLFSLCLFHFLQAQEWAPVGATWHYTIGCLGDPSILSAKYEAIADTVINGKNCRIIKGFHSPANSLKPSDLGYVTFEEGGKVYFYSDELEAFQMYVDYSAETGDTWEVIGYAGFPETLLVKVNSTDEIVLNNVPLKRLHVFIESMFEAGGDYTFIETIGCMERVFFPASHPFWDECEAFEFRCYEDTTLGHLNFVGFACDTVVSATSDLERVHSLSVSPNPFVSEVRLASFQADDLIQQVELRRLDGSQVYFFAGAPISELTIERNDLSGGIYFYKVLMSNGKWATGKIVTK